MSEPGSRPPIRWILALAGMLVVPIAGFIWAAASGGAPDVTAETDGETASEDDEEAELTTSAGATKKKKKKKKKPRPGAPRKVLHKAASCCAALRTAAQEEADISKRPTFLAAASACEAATTAPKAMTQVKSIVGGARVDLPAECSE